MMNTFYKYAQCYANIFMTELEEDFLSGYPYKPLAYYRYIDDIFIYLDHSHNFINSINEQHSNIMFTSNISTTSVSCLDVTIDLDDGHYWPRWWPLLTSMMATFPPKHTLNQQTHMHFFHTTVSTKTYTKSTDTHAFLSYNSFHQRHNKQSIIYSQFLRYKRICSNDEIFLNDVTNLFEYFLARQCPFSDILHYFNKAA